MICHLFPRAQLSFLVSTYEGVRHALEQNNVTNTKVKAFVGGCCASIVGQTIIVPFDVISQHIMLIGLVEKQNNPRRRKLQIFPSKLVNSSIASQEKASGKQISH